MGKGITGLNEHGGKMYGLFREQCVEQHRLSPPRLKLWEETWLASLFEQKEIP